MPSLSVRLPRHMEITELLTREIAAGLRADGSRLPPERELAAELGVAVGTLRKALAELASRGLVDRRQGSGTYVRRGQGPVGIYGFFRLELPEGGGLPGARVIGIERMDKPPHLPAFGSGPQAFRIRRLRTLSGSPVALEEIWLDGRHADRLDPARVSESLYHYYARALRLWIARVEDRIGLGTVPDWAPPDGPLAAGAPAGHVARRAWGGSGLIEEVSTTWFDPARARYTARWS